MAKPLLLLQKKPPPEADKSPGSPKLAIKNYLLRELSALSGSLYRDTTYSVQFFWPAKSKRIPPKLRKTQETLGTKLQLVIF